MEDGSVLLLITTIGHVASALLIGVFGTLIFLHNRKRLLNRTFFFSSIATFLFGLNLAIGINIEASELAYTVWQFNVLNTLILAFFLHFMLLAVDKAHAMRWVIRGSYVMSILIIFVSIAFPQLFITGVEPKLFTKSYINPGPLYILMVLYIAVAFTIGLFTMLRAYVIEPKNRRQLEYFMFATLLGYTIAPIDFLLVFDIPVSPLWGMFFGLYVVPVAYGILADQLLDIRVVIKRAFTYSLIIAGITAVLMLLILLNNLIVATVPGIQIWTIPILVAVVSFIIGHIVWRNVTEADRLKYEFVTVATHKLRTPLTQMNWGIRSLLEEDLSPSVRETVGQVQHANNRLIELSNILFESTQEKSDDYMYAKETIDLVDVTNTVRDRLKALVQEKNITVTVSTDDAVHVLGDTRRITSVVEVLIENALMYTPEGGSVTVSIDTTGRKIHYAVTDSGIGVSPHEQKYLFSRFFRSDAAKRMDTEGVGLGLAMAKNIIKKHKGRIGVESEGEGKGSRFWFTLPKSG